METLLFYFVSFVLLLHIETIEIKVASIFRTETGRMSGRMSIVFITKKSNDKVNRKKAAFVSSF